MGNGMDFEQYVGRRKGRYMAQMLDEFEREIEPRVPAGVAQAFKAHVRRKLNSFATDVVESLKLNSMVRNGAGQDIEDRLFVNGRSSN